MARDRDSGNGVDVEALYRREHDRIRALCLAILRDSADADDAVQEAFARVAAQAGRLDADAGGYLVVVARNVCRDELRRRARRAAAATAVPLGDAELDPREATPEDTAVERGLLGMAWRHLTGVERRLLLDVARGMSMAEIGERTGTSPDTAAQRVSRLRRRIRHIVAAPAAVLIPVLRGSAMVRDLLRRRSAGSLLHAVLGRAPTAQEVAGPVLVGLAAGALALPGSLGPPAHPGARGSAPQAGVHGPAAIDPRAGVANLLGLSGALPSSRLASPPARPVHPPAVAAPTLRPLPPPDGRFVALTPSPSYQTDHTVFASASGQECNGYPCATLWRSNDGGDTWHAVGSTSMPQYTVALPPSYPADPMLFGISASGVFRSDDGGASFRLVVAGSGWLQADIDPTSPPGDTRIFVLPQGANEPAGEAVLYDARADAVHPVTGLPADTTEVNTMFSAPGAPGVYLDIEEATAGTAAYVCSGATTCTRVGPWFPAPTAVSPTFASDHTYFLNDWQALDIDTVDGSSRRVALGNVQVGFVIPAVDFARSRAVDLLVMRPNTYPVQWFGLHVAGDTVTPWAVSLPADADMYSFARLPDGRLLVARMRTLGNSGYVGGGTLCSLDDGQHWAQSC